MGAEQSGLRRSQDIFPSSVDDSVPIGHDETTSLPPSPNRTSLLGFSRNLSRDTKKVPTHFCRGSMPHIPTSTDGDSNHADRHPRPQRAMSSSTTALIGKNSKVASLLIPTRSATISAENSRGVVVVCPGPAGRLWAAASLDFSSSSSTVDVANAELRKLRQISIFEPLLSTSLSETVSSAASGNKRFQPSLSSANASGLVSLSTTYQEYLRGCVTTAYNNQVRVIGLQNKVDYEMRRLAEDLEYREMGDITPRASRANFSRKVDVENTTSKPNGLAGRRQVDAVVLRISQISSLIDQCSILIEQLYESLRDFNEQLPEAHQLSSMALVDNTWKLPNSSQ
ncbi:unnamed protein product [Calicophoron daubneyi]|uniref:BLOC-1-related complex subunit 5 n=1 Tax=Calicophoron daubneyi TaxID=300641 RepID=A0AAV2TMA4_CALDB